MNMPTELGSAVEPHDGRDFFQAETRPQQTFRMRQTRVNQVPAHRMSCEPLDDTAEMPTRNPQRLRELSHTEGTERAARLDPLQSGLRQLGLRRRGASRSAGEYRAQILK
jgi:hypothetical protein